jgi:cell division protein FtsW (lipid II flippase)
VNGPIGKRLPPEMTVWSLLLRIALLLLPVAALAVALPNRPHPVVAVLVVAGSVWWARTPDHVVGALVLVLVALWWSGHGVVDWRLLVVGVLLLAAHVVATLLSYGPVALAVDPHLAALWLRRALIALVPLPITWVALRGLDASLAPTWLWMAAALCVVALVLVTLRFTQPVDE